jgi:fimbrial chaperone protein
MLKRCLILAAVASTLLAPATATAIDVTPMVTRLTTDAAAAGYRLSIRNTSATPITVEITPFRMSLDANGGRELEEDQGDLLVFPPQSIIPPNREQVVQIRYVGDRTIETPRMYLIRAAQLPILLAEDQSQPVGAEVQIAFNVNTHLFVSPPGAAADVVVSASERAPNGDMVLTLENRGTGIGHLRLARYAVTAPGGSPLAIDASKIDMGQVSALPAGASRQVRIPAELLANAPANAVPSVELQ